MPQQDEIYDMKDSMYEVLEHVFNKFPKYHMKILLGDFSAEVCKEYVFKPATGNESWHKISNDSIVRGVILAASQKSDCQKYNVPT
jgi:hypothetical protein